MREVSSKVLEVWERAAADYGIPYERLVQGLSVPRASRGDASEWLDWETLVELVERFERATSPAEIVRIGRAGIAADAVGPIQRVAGLAVGLRQLYRLAMQWQLRLLHRNLTVDYQAVDEGVRIEIRIPTHFRSSAAWFRVIQGGLEGIPTLKGLPHAKVAAQLLNHRAIYAVSFQETRRGLASRLGHWLRAPALRELERQVDELRQMDRERSRVEDALRERERMLAHLIANLSGVVYRCSGPHGRFDFASERSFEVTGYTAEELVQGRMSSLALIHGEDREKVVERRRLALENRQPCSLEYRLKTRDGDVRWVLDVARGVYDAEQRPVALEGFLTDVTERKLLEAEVARTQREEGIGWLAGGIAHDFNNLLTVILGSVELAQAALPIESALRRHTDQILSAAERASMLTQQLLAFARRQTVEPKVVSLNVLVRDMQPLLSRTLHQSIELECNLDVGLWNVEIDPAKLEQVLLNLTINARDAMPHGGALRIETANLVMEAMDSSFPGVPAGPYVMLSVTDDGLGMSEEVRRRAFDPFFTTKEVGKGTGLGLASARGIVRQARGHIFLTSAPESGTTVRILLPRCERPLSARETPSTFPPSMGHECVLVVDDHDLARDTAVYALKKHGYTVLEAGSAGQALELLGSAEGARVDLLLTDIVMPRMSGLELADKVAADRPELPVLFMSGYSEQRALDEHLLGPSRAFLPKPFTTSALTSKVRELLDRAAQRALLE